MSNPQLVYCRNCGLRFRTEFEEEEMVCCSENCDQEILQKKEASKQEVPVIKSISFYIRIGELKRHKELDSLIEDLKKNKDLEVLRYRVACPCDKCDAQFKHYAKEGYPMPFITLSDNKGERIFMKFGIEAVMASLKVLKTTVYAPTRKVKRPKTTDAPLAP